MRVAAVVAFVVLPLSVGGCGGTEEPAIAQTATDAGAADVTSTATDAAAEVASVPDIPAGPPVTPIADPAGKALFDLPFPIDTRRKSGGGLDLSGFPNPGKSELVTQYVALAESALDGFGLTPAIYFRMDGRVDLTSLPPVAASTKPTASVQLVDVTAGAPEYGKRFPLNRSFYDLKDAVYFPTTTLVVQPEFGLVLEEGHTYAAFITTGVRDASKRPIQRAPAIVEALSGKGALAGVLAPLATWLGTQKDVTTDVIAVATVFTTAHHTTEMGAIHSFLQAGPAPMVSDIVKTSADKSAYALYEGTYTAPNFQKGKKPYDTDGDIVFGADKKPVVQEQEKLRFALAVPTDGTMPDKGWPIAIYAHGTGGDYKTFTKEGPINPAKQLTGAGFAVISIDQPLHGDRYVPPDPKSFNIDFASFNYLNPKAGRASFRQSAADDMTLVRVITNTLKVPASASHTGAAILFDAVHVYFLGHSHGGVAGALVAAYESNVRAFALSGAGGGLSNTIMLRTKPYDIAALVQVALGLSNKDELSVRHPVVMLAQLLVDATDPLTYAPIWRRRAGNLPPANVVMINGEKDEDTPITTANALAAAGGLPLVEPVVTDSQAHELLGLAPAKRPVSLNLSNTHGKGTGGLRQWGGASHFAIFDDKVAGDVYVSFFSKLKATGAAVVE